MTKSLDQTQGKTLLQVARNSIACSLQTHRKWQPPHDGLDDALLQIGACFVTLTLQGELRGCIGSLEPVEPLVDNVAHNAYSAAFSDPRFAPLTPVEFERLHIDVSVLGAPVPIQFTTEADLIRQLRVGKDGLILHTPQGYRATFLPSVWEQLPDPEAFLQHLKRKAGLAAHYWHDAMRVERYEVQYFKESTQT